MPEAQTHVLARAGSAPADTATPLCAGRIIKDATPATASRTAPPSALSTERLGHKLHSDSFVDCLPIGTVVKPHQRIAVRSTLDSDLAGGDLVVAAIPRDLAASPVALFPSRDAEQLPQFPIQRERQRLLCDRARLVLLPSC
jgi:hypothetical protein